MFCITAAQRTGDGEGNGKTGRIILLCLVQRHSQRKILRINSDTKYSVNSLALTKQHKHINIVIIRLLIKYVIQQEEKDPSLFSVFKLLLLT